MLPDEPFADTKAQNIDAGCYNIDGMVGDQLCIGSPGTPYVAPPHTSLAPSTATTPAPVPTDVAAGTNTDCGLYYLVEMGDYCNLVILKFGITLPDFVFLNPAINENCTNLFAEESYCVQAVGDSKHMNVVRLSHAHLITFVFSQHL